MNRNMKIDIEDVIYNESFLKNIKRMFITKQMEEHGIKRFTIVYDENIKSFKINLEKDTAMYYIDYMVKRRIKKSNTKNDKCKKRKLNNSNDDKKSKDINNEKKEASVDDFDSSEHNFDNKMSSPTQNTSNNNNNVNNIDNSNMKSIKKNINEDKKLNTESQYKDKKDYKKDKLCKKLYNYIKLFIKLNDIKNCENDMYVKDILVEVEKIFIKYGFVKKLHEMDNSKI
ncbi:unnamed protein product [Mucor hiemalis]